jgi:hypothetical protein
LGIASFIVVAFLGQSPVYVVIGAGIFGYAYGKWGGRKDNLVTALFGIPEDRFFCIRRRASSIPFLMDLIEKYPDWSLQKELQI